MLLIAAAIAAASVIIHHSRQRGMMVSVIELESETILPAAAAVPGVGSAKALHTYSIISLILDFLIRL